MKKDYSEYFKKPSLKEAAERKKEIIIDRFVSAMPQKFEHADGKAMLCGALLTIDDDTNKAVSIELVTERE